MESKRPTFQNWLKEECKDEEFREYFEEEKAALEVACQIMKLRKKKHLTQAQLAKKIGTSQQAISRVEKGDYDGFSYKTLNKIAKALGYAIQIKLIPTSKPIQSL